MGASSTRKGKVGEREWCAWLREHLDAETISRGNQGVGGHADPDVRGLVGWWCEVKRVEKFSVWKALAKVLADVDMAYAKAASNHRDKPMVAFRRNRGKWWVILRAEDWAGLIKAVERAEAEADALRGLDASTARHEFEAEAVRRNTP